LGARNIIIWNIDTSITHVHDRSISWLVTGTSITNLYKTVLNVNFEILDRCYRHDRWFINLISSRSELFITETWFNSINKWIMTNTIYFDLKPSPQSIHDDCIFSSTHPGHRFSRPLENLWKIRCTKGIAVAYIVCLWNKQ